MLFCKTRHTSVFLLLAFFFLDAGLLSAQSSQEIRMNPVYVDGNGIMRWSDSDEEVALFGVNYNVPFAHPYRAVKYIGADHEDVIDQDVYHFARMGLDAYRIHVWDIEISDKKGNLLENDHLRLLDYLIMRLKERGIKVVLSTMRNADNTSPEGEETLAWGFSREYPKYGNVAHHTPEAVQAQQRYIRGFVNHVNQYTGVSYREDPDIIAFEINNEPHHVNDDEAVREYLDTMVEAMRATGLEKPIFYNMSHNFDVTDVFLTSDIQGGTFQWYPTGLMAGFDQKGNFLPNVDSYPILFSDDPRFQKMGKMVYEFSPSDVTDNYLYPAMTRSFREAGMQFITQFSYDAMALADVNSEYNQHHLNLAHTPSKGISFMVASEVARRVPLEADYGTYPETAEFEDFRISYEHNLAEMVNDEAFYYSNDTDSRPDRPQDLQHLAGVGSSPLVEYEGTGAYFLDKLETGVWRLEVMPDAMMIHDPFDTPSLSKKNTRIIWNQWPMKISLPDLGSGFSFRSINRDNNRRGAADEQTMTVSPGVYILTRNGVSSTDWNRDDSFENIKVGEFVAPEPTGSLWDVIHTPYVEKTAGEPLLIRAQVIGDKAPGQVDLLYTISDEGEPRPPEMMRVYDPEQIEMHRTKGYTYEAELPDSLITPGGGIVYYISVRDEGEFTTFPGKNNARPGNWDYYYRDHYVTRFADENAPLQVLNADRDFNYVLQFGRGDKSLVEGSSVGSRAISVRGKISNNNSSHLREFIGEQIAGRQGDLDNFSEVIIRARALDSNTGTLQFGFLTTDGFTYGAPFELTGVWRDIRISLSALEQTNTAMRPSYPRMSGPYFIPVQEIPFDINKIEKWEISTAGLSEGEELSYKVENIWLE